jgi:hypothetical protein
VRVTAQDGDTSRVSANVVALPRPQLGGAKPLWTIGGWWDDMPHFALTRSPRAALGRLARHPAAAALERARNVHG